MVPLGSPLSFVMCVDPNGRRRRSAIACQYGRLGSIAKCPRIKRRIVYRVVDALLLSSQYHSQTAVNERQGDRFVCREPFALYVSRLLSSLFVNEIRLWGTLCLWDKSSPAPFSALSIKYRILRHTHHRC